MQDQIRILKQQALNDLQQVDNTESLPGWFRDYLGKKGAVTALLKQLGTVAAEERPQVGKAINDLKTELQDSFDSLQERLCQQKMEKEIASDSIDVTLPGRPFPTGHLHLTTQTLRKIYQIFAEMGFQVYEAPDVETDAYNFQALNIPEYHPARDMWDTFWVNKEVVLRTHTSPGQIRAMKEF